MSNRYHNSLLKDCLICCDLSISFFHVLDGLLAEGVRASVGDRTKHCWDSTTWERISTVGRPVLPVAPPMRMGGPIMGRVCVDNGSWVRKNRRLNHGHNKKRKKDSLYI